MINLSSSIAGREFSTCVSLTEPVVIDQTANFVDFIDDAVVFTVSRWTQARLWSKVYLFPSVEVMKTETHHKDNTG